MNLTTLKANVYQGLTNTIGYVINEEIDFWNLDHKVILPSPFMGSNCNMFEIFQDSWPPLDISSTLTYLELWP